MAIFCQTKLIFVGLGLATVKKICAKWRKMCLFGPDSVPLKQVLYKIGQKFRFVVRNKNQLLSMSVETVTGAII